MHSRVDGLTSQPFGLSWPLVVGVVTLALFGLAGRDAVLGDPDTYWHLAAGRWILEHGAIPSQDPFSHSAPGAPWVAHEWLSEILLAGLLSFAGWDGPALAAAAVTAGTLAYMTRFLLARMEPMHALALTFVAAMMLATHLLARPHVFAWPVMALWTGTLVNAAESGRRPPWWLLGVMAVWANLHGGFTLGLALAAGLAVEAVLGTPADKRRHAALAWGSFLALAVLASMVTPHGWSGIWHTVLMLNLKFSLEVITEWKSLNFHEPQALELWLLLALALAFSGALRLPWLRIAMLLALVHLALKFGRSTATLGLLSPFLVATPLARHWARMRRGASDAETLDRFFRLLAAPASKMGLALAAAMIAIGVAVAPSSGGHAPKPLRTLEAAVAAARAAGLSGPVLNSYNFGGYLIYRGIPVLIDGRADMYGDEFMKQYVAATSVSEPDALPAMLTKFRIQWTLLQPGMPAVALLDRLPGWRRVYSDDVAVVHAAGLDATALRQ
jgi:hypothetical protein